MGFIIPECLCFRGSVQKFDAHNITLHTQGRRAALQAELTATAPLLRAKGTAMTAIFWQGKLRTM